MKKEDIEKALHQMAMNFDSGIIKKQSSVNKFIVAIEHINNEGVGYRVIFEIFNSLLENKIEYTYFRSLIFRAKKNKSSQTNLVGETSDGGYKKNEVISTNKNSGSEFFSQKKKEEKVTHDNQATIDKFNEMYK